MDERIKRLTRMWMSAQPIVSAFVSSMVRDFGARDDIMQEVVAAIIESFDKYDSERPFIRWSLGVARNQIGLYHRRIRREKVVFDDDVVTVLESAFERVQASEVQKLEFLQGCLEKLNDRDRSLCDLRYEKDMKPASIATIFGTTANGVSKSLQRIRDQLRTCIEIHVAKASRGV